MMGRGGEPNLLVVAQEGRSALHILVTDRLDIGRECDGLLVADERVSRRHLRFEVVDGRLVVRDLGSSNGTFLDGVRVDGPVPFEATSTVTLGSTSIRYLSAAGSDRP